MWKCGCYALGGIKDDCYYKDDRCCYYCDKKGECKANVKCNYDCYDDDNDNKDNLNAYWVEDKKVKLYTISGRTTEKVFDSTINTLIGYYQVNKEVMDDKDDRIDTLENIVDLIKIKDHVISELNKNNKQRG